MSTTDSSQSPTSMDIQTSSINPDRWREEAEVLKGCTYLNLEDSKLIQEQINNSPLNDTIHRVICELYAEKEANFFLSVDSSVDNSSLKINMEKLDELLEQERVTNADEDMVECVQEYEDTSQACFHEYHTKLTRIKQAYRSEYDKLKILCDEYERGILSVFKEQPQCIPISQDVINVILRGSRERTQSIFVHLKTNVIEVVLSVKNSMFESRPSKKRRKNFSKQATEILNEYFYSHLENPYPSEELKTDLAAQCKITIGQVSNWFGNKRIRYKRNIGRENNETETEQKHSPGSATGKNSVKQDLTSSDEDLEELDILES